MQACALKRDNFAAVAVKEAEKKVAQVLLICLNYVFYMLHFEDKGFLEYFLFHFSYFLFSFIRKMTKNMLKWWNVWTVKRDSLQPFQRQKVIQKGWK